MAELLLNPEDRTCPDSISTRSATRPRRPWLARPRGSLRTIGIQGDDGVQRLTLAPRERHHLLGVQRLDLHPAHPERRDPAAP